MVRRKLATDVNYLRATAVTQLVKLFLLLIAVHYVSLCFLCNHLLRHHLGKRSLADDCSKDCCCFRLNLTLPCDDSLLHVPMNLLGNVIKEANIAAAWAHYDSDWC